MVDVAVNVTIVPWQTVFAEDTIEMPTGSEEAETMVIALDMTGFVPLMQDELEVIRQVTTSPSEGIKV